MYKLYKKEGKLKEIGLSKTDFVNYSDYAYQQHLSSLKECIIEPSDWKDYTEGAEVKEFVLEKQWRLDETWVKCNDEHYDPSHPRCRTIAKPQPAKPAKDKIEDDVMPWDKKKFTQEEMDLFAMSYAGWYAHGDDAQIYRSQHLSAYKMLELYKSRPFSRTDAPDKN